MIQLPLANIQVAKIMYIAKITSKSFMVERFHEYDYALLVIIVKICSFNLWQKTYWKIFAIRG